MSRKKTPATRLIIGAVIVAALAVLPFISAIPDFRLALLGRFFCYAIVALGLDLIWGYTGILSLGHGVYFGLGAYCTAMALKLEASGGKMPDFMAWSGVNDMPFWWKPFASPFFALAMAIIVPASLAAFLGWFSFRSRITGVFFSILSQALALVVVTLFVGQQGYTGGTNGMTDFKTFLGMQMDDTKTQHIFYWITLATLVGCYAFSRWLVGGKFGKILVAIRDGENRLRFTGYDPAAYKTFIYTLSGAMAGLAGILFVLQVQLITPTEMDISHSVEMVLWVALGGRGTLIGPILGAIGVEEARDYLSSAFPDYWLYALGFGFLASVLFLPRGIVGLYNDLLKRYSASNRLAPKTGSEIQGVENSVEEAMHA